MNELLLTIALMHGTDAATACYGLHLAPQQTAYTVTERNPFVDTCRGVVGMKGAAAGLSMWAVHVAQKTGHPRIAKVLTFVTIAPSGVGVTFNLKTIRTLRREINRSK